MPVKGSTLGWLRVMEAADAAAPIGGRLAQKGRRQPDRSGPEKPALDQGRRRLSFNEIHQPKPMPLPWYRSEPQRQLTSAAEKFASATAKFESDLDVPGSWLSATAPSHLTSVLSQGMRSQSRSLTRPAGPSTALGPACHWPDACLKD